MKILLAIDDSPFSRDATRILQQQFRTENVEVRVLSVVEPISAYISADICFLISPLKSSRLKRTGRSRPWIW